MSKNVTYDYSRLQGRIVRMYGTRARFARLLGLTPTSFSKKLHNKTHFTSQEISRMIDLLDVADEDVVYYFFLQNVASD